MYSEARLNKSVDCVLLGVSGAWCVVYYRFQKDVLSLRRTPRTLVVGAVFETNNKWRG